MRNHQAALRQIGFISVGVLIFVRNVWAGEQQPILAIMEDELKLSMERLVSPDGTRPYFIQYAVTDESSWEISATLGSLESNEARHTRLADVDVRCGDYTRDSTHQIRGGDEFFDPSAYWKGTVTLPLNGDPLTTRYVLWFETDNRFKSAVKRLGQVKANVKVKVEEEDPSDDFSHEKHETHDGSWLGPNVDVDRFLDRVRKLSQRFRTHPEIYNSDVMLTGSAKNVLAVNSEGSKLQYGREHWRIGVFASTVAEDGMELWQYASFDAHTPEGLPEDAVLEAGVDRVILDLANLRTAPIVEPYTGPAILMNRASGVFFHEIFGHRIEGHRQKDVEEGQTFAKKIGKEVLPSFLSIIDDPTRKQFRGTDLNGFYDFDDECVRAQSVRVVSNGVLETFLLSRSPTRGFTQSNGHGRRQPGRNVVARQGNLCIESTKQVKFDELRSMLINECRKQDKEYGLLFADISGGFTMTQRWVPQAFKVMPILVYRVYPDGRPDELVRGVDIVGTPLTCFSKILATADDPSVFNGFCGAESGWVPVSAISPSILVEQIEIEKKQKAQDRPPILIPPIALEQEEPRPQPQPELHQ